MVLIYHLTIQIDRKVCGRHHHSVGTTALSAGPSQTGFATSLGSLSHWLHYPCFLQSLDILSLLISIQTKLAHKQTQTVTYSICTLFLHTTDIWSNVPWSLSSTNSMNQARFISCASLTWVFHGAVSSANTSIYAVHNERTMSCRSVGCNTDAKIVPSPYPSSYIASTQRFPMIG